MPGFFTTYLDIVACLTTFCLIFYGYRKRRHSFPLPPGPKKLPLVGNLFDMPKGSEWETFARWSKDYNSDIIHASAPGLEFVILNSAKDANELLDRRSAIYSSRHQFTMLSELMGWGYQFVLIPYGQKWRERRRLLQQHFPSTSTKVHRKKIIESVRKLLLGFLDTPENFFGQVRYMSGGFALSIAYGIKILPSDDPHIDFSENALKDGLKASVPGTFLVDLIPALKYIPYWFPGAGFKRKAREWHKNAMRFRDDPFNASEEAIANGSATPSFTSLCIDNLDVTKDTEHQREVIKDTASMFFAAGSDTTIAAINNFLLAMVVYPEVQAKAHKELDKLLRHERLPRFEDEASLPYLSAVLKEVLRWRPPLPIGIPHCLDEDDIYNGYHISAGSVVIGNIWAILRNEEDYPSPDSFSPERFMKDGKLNSKIRDPFSLIFGFGRRICPGSHVALALVWMTAASILSTFEISKEVDSGGKVIEPVMECEPGLIAHPLPFKFKIVPRFREAEGLIMSAVEENKL